MHPLAFTSVFLVWLPLLICDAQQRNPLLDPKLRSPYAVEACLAAARQYAIRDYKGDSLKYHWFGYDGAPEKVIQSAKKMGIKVISGGCVLIDSLDCYDFIADSLTFAKWKVHLSKLR